MKPSLSLRLLVLANWLMILAVAFVLALTTDVRYLYSRLLDTFERLR